MTIAIGGWVLMALAAGHGADVGPRTLDDTIRNGRVVRGFDTASDCEKARQAGQVCVPALALVNR